MSSKYVRLSLPEVNYTKKNFLQSQIDLLEITKCYRVYQKLRKNDLMLKIALKSKIEEIKTSLALLDKVLPKLSLPKEKRKKIHLPGEKIIENLSLEQEIGIIKRKLEKLR